jgi:hypothetical protein
LYFHSHTLYCILTVYISMWKAVLIMVVCSDCIHPNITCFKEFCPSVPQNLVQDCECTRFSKQIKILGIIDQQYALIIIPLFITQAPTCFGTYVPSSGSVLYPCELLESPKWLCHWDVPLYCKWWRPVCTGYCSLVRYCADCWSIIPNQAMHGMNIKLKIKRWQFWQCVWAFWFFHSGKKISIGAGEAISRKKMEREGKVCRLVITESGLRWWRMMNGYVKWNECLSAIIGSKGKGVMIPL